MFSLKSISLTVCIALLLSLLVPISASAQSVEYGWTKTFAGPGYDFGFGVATDPQDNIYVTGYFNNTTDFDPDGAGDEKTVVGSRDGFLTKINADNSYGWTRTFGDQGYDVTTDSQSNVYVMGSFAGTVDFDPEGVGDEKTAVGNNDVFLTKINADNSYGWTRTFGGAGGRGVAIDSSGNVYITGNFAVTVDFDPTGGTDNHTSAGSGDVFLTKINTDGSYGWTYTFGGTSHDQGADVAVDSSDNVYVTGSFNGTVDFDPTAGTDNHTSAGSNDIFLTKINSDGSYGYTYTFGGTSGDQGHDVTVDSSDNVYVTGSFVSTVDFDSTGGTDNHTSSGGSDVFLTKINADGSYEWTQTIGGTGGDVGFGVATDSEDNAYITGSFVGTVDFNPDGGDEREAGGWDDSVFLTQFSADGSYGFTHTLFGVNLNNSGSYAEAVATGENGVYFTGVFEGVVDFNPDGGGDEKSDGNINGDVFLTFLSFASTVVSSSPTPTSVSSQTGTLSVQPSQEGETTYFSHTGTRAKLQVPRGALTLPTQIEIIPHESSPVTDFLPENTTLVPNTLYEYKTSPGLGVSVGDPKILDTFTTPVTVSIQVPEEPTDPSSMQIHYFAEDSQEWIPLPTEYHASSKTFSADTSHFTLFAILEVAEEEPEAVAVSELQEQSTHLLSLIESLIGSVEEGLEEETITPQQASEILSPLDTGLQSLNDLLEQERQSSLQASIHSFANSSALWITLLVLILIAVVTRKRWQALLQEKK